MHYFVGLVVHLNKLYILVLTIDDGRCASFHLFNKLIKHSSSLYVSSAKLISQKFCHQLSETSPSSQNFQKRPPIPELSAHGTIFQLPVELKGHSTIKGKSGHRIRPGSN